MTQDEMVNVKIAEVMGWTISDYIDGGYDLSDLGKNDAAGHWLAHLLVEKMVKDGYFIKIIHAGPQNISAENCGFKGEFGMQAVAANAPGAMRELFCKVYKIEEKK